MHAPQQLEIISLRSDNTENQERIFEQAQRSATAASNRHLNNILTTIVLDFRPNQLSDAAQATNSIVAKAGKEVPKYKGTIARIRSWQSHLKRISHYLLPGKRVWWKSQPLASIFLTEQMILQLIQKDHTYDTRSLKEVTTSTKSLWEQGTLMYHLPSYSTMTVLAHVTRAVNI